MTFDYVSFYLFFLTATHRTGTELACYNEKKLVSKLTL